MMNVWVKVFVIYFGALEGILPQKPVGSTFWYLFWEEEGK